MGRAEEREGEYWAIPKEWMDEEKCPSVEEVWGMGEEVERKVLAKEEEREKREEKAKGEVARCMVCGGVGETRRCGRGGKSVWCGCWETRECARRSVYEESGDMEKAVKEWNRRNGGVVKRMTLGLLYKMDKKLKRGKGNEADKRKNEVKA